MAAEAFAPAKINLTLHVTGQRADGYHLLDSLVVFADVGDRVAVTPGEGLVLSLDGPMAAGVPLGDDNLALRAARLLGVDGASIRLTKNLPTAAGIGGGSSDAAATLRALARLTGRPLPGRAALLTLGADLPVCMIPAPQRMRGIGELLEPVPALPDLWMVLANPGVHVPTPAVFRALARKDGAPMPDPLPVFADAAALADFLRSQRNDLEEPAVALAPVIGAALRGLAAQDDCLLARMSGSGATCFGLFADAGAADRAAADLRQTYPGWWICSTHTHCLSAGLTYHIG